MKIHFLKTIWSDIIILQDGDATALVDTGFAEQFPMIQEYLQSMGISTISFILLTHFHRDHYGSIPALVENFSVEKVYLKEYSGLDCTTAWGTQADDAYRQEELKKYHAMQKLIQEKSTLIQVEGLTSIPFGKYTLQLFSTANSIRQIYEDSTHPETFQKIAFSENQNSLAVFLKADGKTVFLGGDLLDLPASHPLADRVCYQIAQQIGEQIDLYKVPHHATFNTGLPETLSIFRPRTAVITNEEAYLTTGSDALTRLKTASPDIRILLTEKEHVVLSIPEDLN